MRKPVKVSFPRPGKRRKRRKNRPAGSDGPTDRQLAEQGQVRLNPKDRLYLQWVKILNYQDFDHRWLYRESFIADTYRPSNKGWINRVNPAEPWSKDNFIFLPTPDPSLGESDEAYLKCGNEVLTLKEASPILLTHPALLLIWKLELVWDEEVVRTALERMLSSRSASPVSDSHETAIIL